MRNKTKKKKDRQRQSRAVARRRMAAAERGPEVRFPTPEDGQEKQSSKGIGRPSVLPTPIRVHPALADREALLAAKFQMATGQPATLVPQGNDAHIDVMLECGQLFLYPVERGTGELPERHANVAKLWAHDPERMQIVTGYAARRGIWSQHSWCVRDDRIYETTDVDWDHYFGSVLSPWESCYFFTWALRDLWGGSSRRLKKEVTNKYPAAKPLWERMPDEFLRTLPGITKHLELV